jgi:hypothetical protein
VRTPTQIRIQGLIGALVSIAFGLLLSFGAFVLMGREGRLGFDGFNPAGLAQGIVFVVAFATFLRSTRSALRLPTATLLSFGLSAPPTAAKVAKEVPVVDTANLGQTLAENRMVIMQEQGVPVGVSGVRRERLLPWDELVKVDGGVAVTDLRRALAHERVVVVMAGDRVLGVITQDMYLSGLWGTLR